MKKLLIFAILAVTLIMVTAAFAADEDAKEVKKDVETKDHGAILAEMDGKEIYKGLCKSCHGPDADAGEYTPMDLIMEQWDEFFQDTFAETHKDLTCPKDDSAKLTDILSKDILKKVQKFCVDHAADSEQPMTCG